MELTGIQKFKAMNDKHDNLKDCEGLVLRPVAFHTHQYEDAKGKQHTVLVIYNAEKPEIVITIMTSKAGNKYVNFELVEG